ncbi:MAG: alpha/beta hydrolase [Candidatus Bathyarchaeota archaeon]|nr:alpha/beta hydrolase [Candidatus Bathyarchaeota archaeon]
MLTEKTFNTGEVTLNYVEGPDNGPSLVILPAFDNRWQSYISIISHLKQGYHLYGLDARGRGKSGRVPDRYQLLPQVEDTAAFLREVIGEPCILFGHSNGGWAAMGCLKKTPEYLKAVIIGDASVNLPALIESGKTEEEKEGNKWFQDWAGRPVEELTRVLKERYPEREMSYIEMRAVTFSQCDPKIYSDWVEGRLDRYFDGVSMENSLREAKCPVLIVQANPERGMIPDKDVKWALSLNPKVRHVYMSEVDHWLGIQDNKEKLFLDAISSFLNSLNPE